MKHAAISHEQGYVEISLQAFLGYAATETTYPPESVLQPARRLRTVNDLIKLIRSEAH